MKNKKFVSFAGAGGTGKTTVLDPLVAAWTQNGLAPYRFGSVVREYYAMNGLSGQQEFYQLSPNARKEFQIGLLRHYVVQIQRVLSDHPLVISDRTPMDHLNYIIEGSEDLQLAELDLIHEIARPAVEALTHVFYFPYPAHFSRNTDPDSFRVAHPQKNLIVDGLIARQIDWAWSVNPFERHKLNVDAVEDRVNFVSRMVFPDLYGD